MTDNKSLETLNDLSDLLDAEKDALLQGDLDGVARLVERKEALMEELADTGHVEVGMLGGVDEKFKRNQVLLDSALDGIRRVARRLSTLRRVRTALDTYDERGSRQSIDIKTENSFEKRA